MTVQDVIKNFPGRRIAVVGDVMLDRYLIGQVDRVSPEAPIPIVDIKNEYTVPGGAGNTAANIAALGADCTIFAVVGDDQAAQDLGQHFSQFKIKDAGLLVVKRPTTEKTRVVGNHQQIVRIDREEKSQLTTEETAKLCALLKKESDHMEAIVVCDYAKGVVSQELMNCLREIAQTKNIPLLADVRPEHAEYYHDLSYITPNRKETAGMVGYSVGTLEEAQRAATELAKRLKTGVLITMSEDGMLLVESDGAKSRHLATKARQVVDVSGAGDTVIATFALSLAAGADAHMAATIATHAASAVVAKLGTATVSSEELIQTFADHE